MRLRPGFVIVLAGVLSQGASALTDPLPGAVAKPADFELHWPFDPGERVFVASGYGPNAGSPLHRNTSAPRYGNDHYALDLHLTDRPRYGLGRPVRAVASGTVLRAGWTKGSWQNYGQRVIIRHDYDRDGHSYASVYCHLDEVKVAIGQKVNAGDVIGTLGDSCQGNIENKSCPHFTPHLHFALHRDALLDQELTGSTYGGNAVVPEPLGGIEDFKQKQVHIVGGSGEPCRVIELGETVIDELSPCASRSGPYEYFFVEPYGYDGRSFWTFAMPNNSQNAWSWALTFAREGRYAIWAHLPKDLAQSRSARYQVRHSGALETVEVDQVTSTDTWKPLGAFTFAQGGDQWVKLEDVTGEPYQDGSPNNRRLVFDALKVELLEDNEVPLEQPSHDSTHNGQPSRPGGVDLGVTGCSCDSSSPAAASWLVTLLLAALARRARHRR